jgi:surface carbohydrate biosynthesis protein
MSTRYLYLPVETKAREFLGKTFLAARAVERSWTVVLGEGNQVREFMQTAPVGAYIEIGIPENKAKRLETIHASGHSIASLCEEGLIYADGSDYCNRKLGPRALSWTDRLLVVGSRNAEDIRLHRPESTEKLVVTGNPRFDTLLSGLRCVYQDDADILRQQLGRFVLINTNFTRANPYDPAKKDPIAKLVKRGKIGGTEHKEFFRRFIEYQTRLMSGLQDLLKVLAASHLVDRIVIRPHPVENRDAWRRWAEPLNVEVHCEGSAIEWLLAAEAVLHPGCTTGIEGLILDRPVFSYVPEPDSEFINPSDLVSEQVNSAEDFLERLSQVRGQDETTLHARFACHRERLSFFVANVNPPYAADRILDELERLALPETSVSRAGPRKSPLLSQLRRRLHPWRSPDHQRTARQLQKLPGLSEGEVNSAVGHWLGAGILHNAPRIDRLGERLLMFH